MGERTVRIRKVAGSIPVRSTKNAAHRFRLAKFVRPRFFHRGIIPLLTLFFSASGSQKTAVTPLEDSGRCHSACRPLRGDQFPDDPRWLSGQAGAFCSLTALSRRNHAPRQTHPASWERQRTAPRRGASLKCGRNLRFPHKRPLPEMQRWGLVIGSVCADRVFSIGGLSPS